MGDLTVTTARATNDQCQLACDALQSQRQRLSTLLRGLPSDTWHARSRCSEWTVHEVVRHICDGARNATALLQGKSPADVDAENMDPRTTPLGWLERSAGEKPADTLSVLDEVTADLLAEVDRRSDRSAGDVEWVYGCVPWSIAVLHVFWDAWIHERDIVLALGRPQECPAVESRAAAVYGLVMAALPNLVAQVSFDETVQLTGGGGGLFRVEVRSESQGGRQLTMAGIPAAGDIRITVGESGSHDGESLQGPLTAVVDSLVGREPELTTVLIGQRERVQRLSMLRTFMLLPTS